MPSALTISATPLKIFIEGEGQMPDTVFQVGLQHHQREMISIVQSADQTPHVAQWAACLIDGDGTGAHHHLQVLYSRAADPPVRSQPL